MTRRRPVTWISTAIFGAVFLVLGICWFIFSDQWWLAVLYVSTGVLAGVGAWNLRRKPQRDRDE